MNAAVRQACTAIALLFELFEGDAIAILHLAEDLLGQKCAGAIEDIQGDVLGADGGDASVLELSEGLSHLRNHLDAAIVDTRGGEGQLHLPSIDRALLALLLGLVTAFTSRSSPLFDGSLALGSCSLAIGGESHILGVETILLVLFIHKSNLIASARTELVVSVKICADRLV